MCDKGTLSPPVKYICYSYMLSVLHNHHALEDMLEIRWGYVGDTLRYLLKNWMDSTSINGYGAPVMRQ